jgi:hypothetical protein
MHRRETKIGKGWNICATNIANKPSKKKKPVHIVAYLFKARTVEQEKQPLLGSGSPNTSVARQWFSSSHEIAARDAIKTMEKWLEAVLFLAVLRRRRRKGNPMPGGITGPPCSGVINTGTWPSSLGESWIWDSRIWSWVPRYSDLRTVLARSSANC